MDSDSLLKSLNEYAEQLSMIEEALKTSTDSSEKESLLSLKHDLNELVELTNASLQTVNCKETTSASHTISEDKTATENKAAIDDEYLLFMQEMAKEGAYSDPTEKPSCSKELVVAEDVEIDDELASLLGMRCSVYHAHKWGGQPSLHNAMVCSIVPPQSDDQFKDLQVMVLFTHPTHTEMLPCPFFLNGECKFDDDKCRYSHGTKVQLSELKDAMEPDFEGIRVGSRVLLKLNQPHDEDISLTKKCNEKYHLWHRAVVKGVDLDSKVCVVKVEHGVGRADKRKAGSDETVPFENIFPLDTEDTSSDSEGSLSDTEFPESKAGRSTTAVDADQQRLLIEKSLQNNGPAMGDWERHTRGMGSKLMLAMGYVPGTGLGAASDGRVAPVDARLVPRGTSLDHLMALGEKNAARDPLKVEQKLKRLQKKEEEKNIKAYARAKEKEKRNVFNFLNKTLGDKSEESSNKAMAADVKQSSSRDLNIESFKILEDIKRVDRDIMKLNSSLQRHQSGTTGHKNIILQITEKRKELETLKSKEHRITKEQKQRKDKHKLSIF